MTGGLFDPLGTDRPDLPGRGARPPAGVLAAGAALGAVAILLAVSWLRDDGDRGRPVAVAPIEHVQAPSKPPPLPQPAAPVVPPATTTPTPPAAVPATPPASAAPPPARDDQDVEIQNGVRIVRPRRDGAASQTIRIPDLGQRR